MAYVENWFKIQNWHILKLYLDTIKKVFVPKEDITTSTKNYMKGNLISCQFPLSPPPTRHWD